MLLAKTLRSTTFRLALLNIALFGVVVLGLLAYVHWASTSLVVSRSDQAIDVEHEALHAAYAARGRAGLVQSIDTRRAIPRVHSRIYLLADGTTGPVAGNLEQWPPGLAHREGRGELTVAPTDGGVAEPFRVAWETLADGSRLLVGTNMGDISRFRDEMTGAFAFAIAFMVLLAAVASVDVTRRTITRIESINDASHAIVERGLGERIALRGTRDEWDRLAENLNAMLERIEVLVDEVKQVTDNVAHDLRTPLTRMRGRLEKAYGRSRDETADQALIGDTMADLEGVLRMFSALTRISQVAAYDRTAAFRTVDLAQIAGDVVELFDAAVEDDGGRLRATGDAHVPVRGDRDLLFDALANLVDNAIKHGRGGDVTVEVMADEGGATVAVCDDGPGIPAGEHPHVFKRFYRLERSRQSPGNGLGLSLVAAVARLHDARIALVARHPGLRVEVRFPRP